MSGGQPANSQYSQPYPQSNPGQSNYQPGQGSSFPNNQGGQNQSNPYAGSSTYQQNQPASNQNYQNNQQPNQGQNYNGQGQPNNYQNPQSYQPTNQPSGGQGSQQYPSGSNQGRPGPNPAGATDSSVQPGVNRPAVNDPNSRSQPNSAHGGNSTSQGGSAQQPYNQGGASNPYNPPSVTQPQSYNGQPNNPNSNQQNTYGQPGPQQGYGQQNAPPQRDPDVMIELKEAFKMLLPAGKSELGAKEIKIAVRAFGLGDVVQNVDELSKNNMNQVQFENAFYPLIIKHMYSDAEMVRLFKILDLEGKSKINYQNLKEICKHSGENFTDDDLRDIITEADKDRDQALNYQEFVA